MIKNKNILITGGAGFIGYHLLKKLAIFNNVTVLDNLQRGKNDNFLKELIKLKNVKFFNIDLTKKNKLKKKKYDFVFFLASIVGVKNVNNQPFNTIQTNIQSTFSTLDLIKFKKDTKLIYFSTSEVYSPLVIKKKNSFPIKENVDLLFLNNDETRYSYYISKLLSEKIIKFFGLPFLILRPHNIYGPRMGYSHVIPEQIRRIKNKSKSKVFSPTHKRAFCYIDDAIDQMLSLCSNKKSFNKIYNIGNPKEPISMIKLSQIIKRQLGSNTKLLKGNITSGSISKRIPLLKKELSKYCKVSLKDGIKKTIKWYNENENL